jgi:pyridoxine kinase
MQSTLCNSRIILVSTNYIHVAENAGYLQWTGFRTTATQILELFQGLQQSGIDNFQYLLTGYLPNADTVAAIGTIAKTLKAKDPGIIWSNNPDLATS